MSHFTAIVSNPPYQTSNGGKNTQIYAETYLIGRKVAQYSAMVFPLGWQTSLGVASGSALHYLLKEDTKIVSVDNYYENQNSPVVLFRDAATGGVNIVFRDAEKEPNAHTEFYEYGELKGVRDFSAVERLSAEITRVLTQITAYRNAHDVPDCKALVSPMNPFGIKTFFLDENRADYTHVTEHPNGKNTVKFLGTKKGKTDYKFYYLPRDFVSSEGNPVRTNNEDKWKLIWPKSGAYAHWRSSRVLKPKELFTDTFIGVWFDTQVQAENYRTYLQTKLYRFMVSVQATDHNATRKVHAGVPDLTGVTNPRTGLVGWESDWTDADIKGLLADYLNDDDWAYIEQAVVESDPVGERQHTTN